MKTKLIGLFTICAMIGWAQPQAYGQLDALRQLAGGSKKPEPKKIARISLRGPLTETPVEIPPLFSSETPNSLKEILERITQARGDDNVLALILDVDGAALGLGQLEEIHEAVRKFRAVDKEVYVHADSLATGTYALASCASHISLVPTGDLWLLGLYGEAPYLRGGLDKLGIVPDFEQCGDFKTGAESITRTEPSEASKKMTGWLLDSLYASMVKMMADARNVDEAHMRNLIDNGPYSSEDALAAGLIDSVKYRHAFASFIRDRYGEDVKVVHNYGEKGSEEIPDNMFAAFEMFMEIFAPSPRVYTDPSIAIVYVEGPIMTGSAQVSPFGSTSGAFSTSIRKALDDAAEDDSVKAVVLRVDSPGGSALASEIILEATRRVAERKPLVVSMGNVAGSGGYYVTCASRRIFADEHTITASIGVLGGKLVTTGFWDKLGINWHANARGEMAGMMSTSSKFSEKERAKLRQYMETVYGVFLDHVKASRGEKLAKPLSELAGGRVFTGQQALELGLVDEIGGLHDAIKYAAAEARQTDYEIRVIPEPPSMFEMLTGKGPEDEKLSLSFGGSIDWLAAPGFGEFLPVLAKSDPLRFKALVHQLMKLSLLSQEQILMVMPEEYLVR